MTALAEAFIELRTDGRHLTSDVRRDATKAGATGGTVMGREFGTAFRRVSRTLIGLGIGTFAFEAGRSVLGFADDFERSRSRLETITKNIGSDFGSVSGAIAVTDKRMEAFGFTNAQTESSLAGLESATKNVPQSLKLVALAADIARGRNISLDQSTALLMRAETGHVASLGRLGIATKDAAGNTLTLGQELDLLAQRYGGAASNFAATYAGRQEAVTATIHDSAAAIGVALLPAAADLAKVLQDDVLPPLKSSAQFFDRNRRTIEPLVGVVLKLALAYKAVKLAQKGLAAISAARGAGAAAGAATVAGGESALGLEAFSVAHPLPVLVVNQAGGVKPGGAVVTPAEEAAGAGGAGLFTRLLPAASEGLLKIAAPVFAAFEAYKLQQNVRAGQKSGGTLGTIGAGASSLGHLIGKTGDILGIGGGLTSLGSLLGIAGHAAKNQSAAVTSVAHSMGFLGNVTHIVIAAEHSLGGAVNATTVGLHKQVRELRNTQAAALSLSQGQDDLRSAVHNMAVTVGQQSSRALRGNSDAALANRDALRGAVGQAESYLKTLKQRGASAGHIARVEYALSRAIKHNADETYGDSTAVRHLLKQLGFLPGQIQGVVDAFYAGSSAADVFANHTESLAQRGIYSDSVKKKARTAGTGIATSVVGGYSDVVDKGVADASKKAADAAKAAFDKARSQMQSDLSSFKSFYSQQRQTILSTFSSFDTTSGTDLLGASGPPKPLLGQLSQEAKAADTFTRLWLRLDDKHLDPRLLDMFEGLGPQAIPTMRLWLSHPRDIRRADRLEGRIGRDATRIGARATEDRFDPRIHQDLRDLPARLLPVLERGLRHMHINIDLNAVDHREGLKVQHS